MPKTKTKKADNKKPAKKDKPLKPLEPAQQTPEQEMAARARRCETELMATLNRHRCRMSARILQPEPVGDGSRVMLGAQPVVIPEP